MEISNRLLIYGFVLSFNHEDEGTAFLRNIGDLPHIMVSHPCRPHSSSEEETSTYSEGRTCMVRVTLDLQQARTGPSITPNSVFLSPLNYRVPFTRHNK
jgi:hypothetical protein